jgi:hypothetical protein
MHRAATNVTPRPDPIPIQPDTGQRIIVFHVLNDPAHPDCAPLDEIKLLLRIGAMPRLSTLWGRLPGGDCSAIADAMLLDLRDAGRQHGGSTASATASVSANIIGSRVVTGASMHHMVIGGRAVLVMRSVVYRALRGAEHVTIQAFLE